MHWVTCLRDNRTGRRGLYNPNGRRVHTDTNVNASELEETMHHTLEQARFSLGGRLSLRIYTRNGHETRIGRPRQLRLKVVCV